MALEKHRRSQTELLHELHEQVEALKISSKSYDSGNFWEAKRLATTVVTLAHDGNNSNSILKQMGLKGKLDFLTTGFPPNKPGHSTIGILNGMCGILETADGLIFDPSLSGAFNKRYVKFHHWWDEVLFSNQSNYSITRKNLVFNLRSKDGGSHFDKSLPESAYLSLKFATDTGIIVDRGPMPAVGETFTMNPIPVKWGHLALMRQISYELIESLSPILNRSAGDSA